MNKLIPSTIKMDNPNEAILIYEGLVDVIYNDHVENSILVTHSSSQI